MSHPCPECGLEHAVVGQVADDAVPAAAAVEIAGIEAERDITLAKIAAKSEDPERGEEIARLRGELTGLRELVQRLAPPPPEPEPVPVPVPVPDPESDPVVDEPAVEAPPVVEPAPSSSRKRQSVWW